MSTSPSDENEQAMAERAARIMAETRFQQLRSRPARIALAVSMIALILIMPVGWILLGSAAGLALVVASVVVWLLLRRSVRLVADLPDEYLDERQTDLRNRSYLEGYRWFAGLVLILAGAGFFAFTVLSGDSDTWTVTLGFDTVMGWFWMLEAAALSVPSVVLALRDRELPR